MKTRTSIKAGGLTAVNHNEGIRVHSNVKAGGIKTINHNEKLRVRTGMNAGKLAANHNQKLGRR